MIPWFSCEKVRALDAQLIQAGVPGLTLMERVGQGIADFILSLPVRKSAVVFAGAGNNGGDGFVIARLLLECGWNVAVVMSHPTERSRGDAGVNLKRLQEMDAEIYASSALSDDEILELLAGHDLAVDALLGTGATGAPRGEILRLIDLLNGHRHGHHVLAVDLPSGAESDGSAVEAEWTCTAAARKLPMATGRGAALSGKIVLIPLDEKAPELLGQPNASELERRDVRALLPRRRADDHKGSRGGVLIVAGSTRYRGAALLAARGALRTGAGLVVLASVPEVLNALTIALPEAIAEPLDDPEGLPRAMEKWRRRCSVLLVGSGLDRDERAQKLCELAANWDGPSLWDGDGLFWLAHDKLKPSAPCLTPHEGEAATLLGDKSSLGDRFLTAGKLSETYGSVLLKGYHSIVASRGKLPLIVSAGDRTLSIPGSGDVLAGTVSAFLAAGLPAFDALALGAWCHGVAGEELGREKGRDGVLAHEVADRLPYVLKELHGTC